MADHVIIKTSLTPIIDMTDDDAENKLAILNNSNWTFGTIGTSAKVSMNPDYASSREAISGGLFDGNQAGQTQLGNVYIKHTGKTVAGVTTNQPLYIHRHDVAFQEAPQGSADFSFKIAANTSFIGTLHDQYYYWIAEYGGVEDDTPVIQYWYEEI